MKHINITGNEKKIIIEKKKTIITRNVVKYIEPTIEEQVIIINNYYMDINDDYTKDIKSEINRKISGYKNQDIKKGIYNEIILINSDNIIEKLVACKLKCYYCCKNVKILYKIVRDEQQWTLDRIDNDKCHSDINTVISCLKCNLQRRVKNSKDFVFTKQLKISKLG
tara:strand:+ start:1227 stop:1727 length:501 start_codon:yes stop_codon:yes gene_type:complete